jgi:hypothetical protein
MREKAVLFQLWRSMRGKALNSVGSDKESIALQKESGAAMLLTVLYTYK